MPSVVALGGGGVETGGMFTGLVEETGAVVSLEEQAEAWRLTLEADLVLPLAIGDSLACNGCCLTVVAAEGKRLSFDLLEESLRLTSFHQYKPGDKVNLERSLKADARLGGHFVSGHVDCTGEVTVFEPRGKNHYLRAEVPAEFQKYLVYKGSVALDGISLTVAEADDAGLAVWLIPHTLEVTNLHQRKVGDAINLEFDLLAKYVEKLLPEKI